MPLCPTPRSLDRTPGGNCPKHTENIHKVTDVGSLHIVQKCKGHTTDTLSPPLESPPQR